MPGVRRVTRGDLAGGLGLLAGLPAFLRAARVSAEESRAVVAARLRTRADDFLRLVRVAVFDRPMSPYRGLLAHAGVEYPDLVRLVRTEGLEGALSRLCRDGVYLTLDELKGRRPVVRGTLRLEVDPSHLRRPGLGRFDGRVPTQSSGSRGAPAAPIPVSLKEIATQAVDQAVLLDARDDLHSDHAIWNVPGGAALEQMLWFARCGVRPARWFSQIDPHRYGLHVRYRWSGRLLYWGSRVAGVPIPWPEFVSLEDPRRIVDWMAESLKAGRVPHLWTYASAAVRVSAAAAAFGQRLEKARFSVSGEPVTQTRLAAIRDSGADPLPRFGSSECGYIASGCLHPVAPDDMHLLTDLHAVIRPGEAAASMGLDPDALLISSLREYPRLVLLNAALGDRAEMDARVCGCPLEAVGWTSHVRHVRSDARITVAGVAVLDADVVHILEEILPRRFGGGATDYQLVEEADAAGQPCLTLLASPPEGGTGRLESGRDDVPGRHRSWVRRGRAHRRAALAGRPDRAGQPARAPRHAGREDPPPACRAGRPNDGGRRRRTNVTPHPTRRAAPLASRLGRNGPPASGRAPAPTPPGLAPRDRASHPVPRAAPESKAQRHVFFAERAPDGSARERPVGAPPSHGGSSCNPPPARGPSRVTSQMARASPLGNILDGAIRGVDHVGQTCLSWRRSRIRRR